MKTSSVARRWAVVNRNTGNVRRFFDTRAAARSSKRPTERIFDNYSESYVR